MGKIIFYFYNRAFLQSVGLLLTACNKINIIFIYKKKRIFVKYCEFKQYTGQTTYQMIKENE